MAKRVFLFVLDSLGVGEAPDAAAFGDHDCHTLKRIAGSPAFHLNALLQLGLGHMDGQDYLPRTAAPQAAVCRLAERSAGKDTTIGHWEIAGVVSPSPLPTYPEGFPADVLQAFSAATGRGVLCNKPYSGTDVIRDYGQEHWQTGKLIVYTSADSVFQIAAHEELVPPEQLYEYCRAARAILTGPHAVGRVIARPFVGKPGAFTRTANRRDFSLQPPRTTLLDALQQAGKTVYAVGKISDVFAGRGITKSVPTHGNAEGMAAAMDAVKTDFEGLCFINLVDFDMLYGHRQDVDGYAAALTEFDRWLPGFMAQMGPEDLLMITADHGCDPGDSHTDHSREYTPLLVYGAPVEPVNLGTRSGFCHIAATVADYLDCDYRGDGQSLWPLLCRPAETRRLLCRAALNARRNAYAPYSGYRVGAALLGQSGRIYTGCNIENAAFSPTVCAERTALFKAVSEGERAFAMLAVCGGKEDAVQGLFPPCGVCRQALCEFCAPAMPVLLITGPDSFEEHTLGDLLPLSFSLPADR